MTTLNLNQSNHEGRWIDPDCFANFLVIEEMKGSKKDQFEALQTAPPASSGKAFRKAYERPINVDKHQLKDGYILIVSSNYGRSRSDYFDVYSYGESNEGTPVIQHLGREHPTFEGFEVANRGHFVEIRYKKYAGHHLDSDRINVSKRFTVNMGSNLLRPVRWGEVYSVPPNEKWLVSWVSPYEPFEIRPLYDVRIHTGNFDNLNESVSAQHRNRKRQTTSVVAISNSDPAIVMLYGGARFDIANDLLSLSITRYTDADIGN